MITLKDNTKYPPITDNPEKFLLLQNIANRRISELLDENGNNLLVYPHSFELCEDESGNLPLLSIQTCWKETRCTKVILETGNIAGFIGIDGKTVSIHSRFTPNNTEDFFLHYMLSKVLCINVMSLSHGTSNEQIFNLLLYLFPKLLNEALAQGIYKEYVRNEYNDANVRGSIDINRHLKSNMPFNGRVAYRTREFSHDNHVTELIRHTIEYICQHPFGKSLLENNAETRADVAQIISATPHYCRQKREHIIKSNSKIISHPYYSRYAPLQKLCLRILRHERLKYGESGNKIYGILFDVSYLWEEYLATLLTKQGFKHPNNKNKTGRIYLAKQKRFPRYPDFYREYDHTIIDAKYKRTVLREDIHQMITYMYRLKGTCGIFIQPTEHELKTVKSFLLGYGSEVNASLQTYFYPIPQNAPDYNHFVSKMLESENALQEILNNPITADP